MFLSFALSILPSIRILHLSLLPFPSSPQLLFYLVCNSFTVFSFLASLPPSLPPSLSPSLFVFEVLHSNAALFLLPRQHSLSPCYFSFILLFHFIPSHPQFPTSPSPPASFHFCVSKKRLKKKKYFHRWFYLNTSTNEV